MDFTRPLCDFNQVGQPEEYHATSSFQMTEKVQLSVSDFPDDASFDDLEQTLSLSRYSKNAIERFQNTYFTNFCIGIKVLNHDKIWPWIFSSIVEYDDLLEKPDKYI
jgi:hypothetical protein